MSRVELPERFKSHLEPRHDERRLGQQHPAGARLGRNRRRRRHVALADVLGERASDQLGVRVAPRRVEGHHTSAGFSVTATEGSPTVSDSAPARTAAFKSRSMARRARISSSAAA